MVEVPERSRANEGFANPFLVFVPLSRALLVVQLMRAWRDFSDERCGLHECRDDK